MPIFITKCYFGDDLSGSFYLEINKYNCSILVFKRKDSDNVREFTENFCKPAVYVLMNREDRKAYIGQTDNFYTRIQNHIAKKDFWDTAIAFTAKDNSLSSTEVRYLEAEAYEAAQSAGRYDLSENGQAPQKPHVTYQQKLQTEEFFKTIRLFAQDIGCDVFRPSAIQAHPKRHVNTAPTHKKAQQPTQQTSDDDVLKGYVKLTLDGEGPYKKNEFVHAVIRKYLEVHPNTTLAELKTLFPTKLLKKWARWELIQDDIRYASESLKNRYLLGEKYILTTGDGVRFVVCSQWDYHNLPNVISIVESEGWKYTIVK